MSSMYPLQRFLLMAPTINWLWTRSNSFLGQVNLGNSQSASVNRACLGAYLSLTLSTWSMRLFGMSPGGQRCGQMSTATTCWL